MTLGRLATKAADLFERQLNPQYVPYIDMGDHVIVINREKVRLTGLKAGQKLTGRYHRFSRRVCARSRLRAVLNRKPEMILEQAIKGNAGQEQDGRQMATKLRVIAAPRIRHQAQMPVALEIS